MRPPEPEDEGDARHQPGQRVAIEEIRRRWLEKVGPERSVVDEFIAERRAEAKRD